MYKIENCKKKLNITNNTITTIYCNNATLEQKILENCYGFLATDDDFVYFICKNEKKLEKVYWESF